MPSSLIYRSSLNYFPAHQSLTINSMHLQSTYTPYLQLLFNRWSIWNTVQQLQRSGFAEIVDVFKLLAILEEKLHRGCLAGF